VLTGRFERPAKVSRYIRLTFVLAPIAQSAEAADLKSAKCRFESDWGHELGVVSGCSRVGQSVLLLDNVVHSFTLMRPCSDGLTSLRISSGSPNVFTDF
jgi:hypothetical protein